MTVPVDDSVASKYKNHKYRLAAVVAHSGESSKAGHYISYVRDPLRKGSWVELDDDTVKDIDFEEINHNTGTEQMLPYIMAWELITDANEEVDPPETEEQRSRREIAERARALDEREESLNRQVEELTKQLNEKDLALQRREQELIQKELALRTPEKTLDEKEKAFTEKERKLTARGVAVLRKAKELGEKQRALDQREGELEERERDLQAKKEVGNSIQDSGMPPEQTEKIKTSIEQDVDSRKDTATFCATFRNADDHEENARAVFKLKNLKLNVPTRIESAVQLSDLEGNLRSIKKGTTITDEFIITFNVKGGKKRKRGDDDKAGSHPPPPPSPPAKKKKAPAKQADQDQTSKVKGEAKASPKIKNEPQSPKLLENPTRGSPKLRRSTRVNRGQNPRRA
jgi:Ubiquitin carboxyl-terminal hydrolase